MPTYYFKNNAVQALNDLENHLGMCLPYTLDNIFCITTFTPELPVRSSNNELSLKQIFRPSIHYTDVRAIYEDVQDYFKFSNRILELDNTSFFSNINIKAINIRKSLFEKDFPILRADWVLRSLLGEYINKGINLEGVDKIGTNLIPVGRERFLLILIKILDFNPFWRNLNVHSERIKFSFCSHNNGWIALNLLLKRSDISMFEAINHFLMSTIQNINVFHRNNPRNFNREYNYFGVCFNRLNMEFVHMKYKEGYTEFYTVYDPNIRTSNFVNTGPIPLPKQVYLLYEYNEALRKFMEDVLRPREFSGYFYPRRNI